MKEQIKEWLLTMQSGIIEALNDEHLTQYEIDKLLDSLIENKKAIAKLDEEDEPNGGLE